MSEIALDEQRKKSNPIGSQTNTITMKRKETSNVLMVIDQVLEKNALGF